MARLSRLFGRARDPPADTAVQVEAEWHVGGRYEVLRVTTLFAGPAPGSCEVSRAYPRDVLLLLAFSREPSADGEGEIGMALLANTKRPDWVCGWARVEDFPPCLSDTPSPALRKQRIRGSWHVGGRYRVVSSPVLRAGAELESEQVCEIAAADRAEVLILDLCPVLLDGLQVRLRAHVRAFFSQQASDAPSQLEGWLTVEGQGVQSSLLEPINLHCEDTSTLGAASGTGGGKKLGRFLPIRKKNASEAGGILDLEKVAATWRPGGKYRALQRAALSEEAPPESKIVAYVKKGVVVFIRQARVVPKSHGGNQLRLMVSLENTDGKIHRESFWLSPLTLAGEHILDADDLQNDKAAKNSASAADTTLDTTVAEPLGAGADADTTEGSCEVSCVSSAEPPASTAPMDVALGIPSAEPPQMSPVDLAPEARFEGAALLSPSGATTCTAAGCADASAPTVALVPACTGSANIIVVDEAYGSPPAESPLMAANPGIPSAAAVAGPAEPAPVSDVGGVLWASGSETSVAAMHHDAAAAGTLQAPFAANGFLSAVADGLVLPADPIPAAATGGATSWAPTGEAPFAPHSPSACSIACAETATLAVPSDTWHASRNETSMLVPELARAVVAARATTTESHPKVAFLDGVQMNSWNQQSTAAITESVLRVSAPTQPVPTGAVAGREASVTLSDVEGVAAKSSTQAVGVADGITRDALARPTNATPSGLGDVPAFGSGALMAPRYETLGAGPGRGILAAAASGPSSEPKSQTIDSVTTIGNTDQQKWTPPLLSQQWSEPFTISLDCSQAECLGLEVDQEDGRTLKIDAIVDGPFKKWNAEHPGAEVRVGDRIVAANGRQGDVLEIIEELCQRAPLHVTLQRLAAATEPISMPTMERPMRSVCAVAATSARPVCTRLPARPEIATLNNFCSTSSFRCDHTIDSAYGGSSASNAPFVSAASGPSPSEAYSEAKFDFAVNGGIYSDCIFNASKRATEEERWKQHLYAVAPNVANIPSPAFLSPAAASTFAASTNTAMLSPVAIRERDAFSDRSSPNGVCRVDQIEDFRLARALTEVGPLAEETRMTEPLAVVAQRWNPTPRSQIGYLPGVVDEGGGDLKIFSDAGADGEAPEPVCPCRGRFDDTAFFDLGCGSRRPKADGTESGDASGFLELLLRAAFRGVSAFSAIGCNAESACPVKISDASGRQQASPLAPRPVQPPAAPGAILAQVDRQHASWPQVPPMF